MAVVTVVLVVAGLATAGCGKGRDQEGPPGPAKADDPCSDAPEKPVALRPAHPREVIGVRWRYLQVGDCVLKPGDPASHDS